MIHSHQRERRSFPKAGRKHAGLTKTTERKLLGHPDFCKSSCYSHVNLIKGFNNHLQNQIECVSLPSALQWCSISKMGLGNWQKILMWFPQSIVAQIFRKGVLRCHLEKERKVATSNLFHVIPSALQIYLLSNPLSKVHWLSSIVTTAKSVF